MNITIASPNGIARSVSVSKAMQDHFSIPINHANTILKQINDGMYSRWFTGKQNLTCIDFGANVGLVSLYMAPACKELIAVEPTPNHFNLMVELLESHMGPCLIHVSNKALAGSHDQFTFATGHSTENKITSPDGYGNHKIMVEGHPLNYFLLLTDSNIDFCKVDIEGGEMMALTEKNILSSVGKVKCFFVEVHPAYGGGLDENREELKKRFSRTGFRVEQLDFQTIIAEYDC